MAKENSKLYLYRRQEGHLGEKRGHRSWFCFSYLIFVNSIKYLLNCHHMPDPVLVHLGIKQSRQYSSCL